MKLYLPGRDKPLVFGENRVAVNRADLRIDYEIHQERDLVQIHMTLSNTGSQTVKLSSLDILDIFEIYPPVYHNSWQSWLPFKAYMEQPETKDLLDFAGMTDTTPYHLTPTPEILQTGVFPSDYFVASRSVVCGFLDSAVSHPYFAWSTSEERIEARVELFGKPLEPGSGIHLEPVVVISGDELPSMLERYATLISEYKRPSFKSFEGIGWCSWYHYFEEIDMSELQKNTEMVSDLAKKDGVPFSLVQLDDGYQKDIGEWTTTNEKFPQLDVISSYIRSKSLKPGIWVAPFSVSETSRVFSEHEEWLVKDAKGEPKRAYRNWGKNIYSLDPTNPKAADFLAETMLALRNAGFKYVKIDFLFGGAIPGRRHIPNTTPVEAYVKGLRIIREALGEDVFIVGCGAPLLPSVGHVDAMRIGADTAPSWNEDIPDNGIPSFRHCLRNALTRSFMHGKLWLNDPDTIILRGQEAELSLSEARMFALACGILDNLLLESDDMSLVGQEGLEILMKAFSFKGRKTRVFLNGNNDVFIFGARGTGVSSVLSVVNLGTTGTSVLIPDSALDWLGHSAEYGLTYVEPRSIWVHEFA